jgi:hypothetical protein
MKNYEYVDRELNVSKKKMNNKCCSNTSCDEKTCTKQAINKSVIDDITGENNSSIWDNESFWDAYYKSLGPYKDQLDLPFIDEDKSEYDIDWKYNELEILDDIERYIAETYSEHYSENSDIQLAEYLIARGRGEDFFIGNILKYADRYGKKSGYNIIDMYKVIHYAILEIYNHQMAHKDANWY